MVNDRLMDNHQLEIADAMAARLPWKRLPAALPANHLRIQRAKVALTAGSSPNMMNWWPSWWLFRQLIRKWQPNFADVLQKNWKLPLTIDQSLQAGYFYEILRKIGMFVRSFFSGFTLVKRKNRSEMNTSWWNLKDFSGIQHCSDNSTIKIDILHN